MDQPIVISIIGPTAVGKTKLGIELSKRINGEVINADSMQFFKGFDIGSAKVTEDEADGIPHHLIDHLDPLDEYSAAEFKSDLYDKVQELTQRSKQPLIVGGTGFYVHSALFDFQFSDVKRDSDYVEKALQEIKINGIEPYYEKLKQVDPIQAEKVHPHNIRRVIRALEVYATSGQTLSEIESNQKEGSAYQPIIIGLNMERETLYERINKRVDQLVEQGLIEEVRELYSRYGGDVQPMQGIGYKEWIPFFEDEYSKEEAIRLIKRNTRRFAKRQLTYYRNKIPDVYWYNIDPDYYMDTFENIFQKVEGMIDCLSNRY
ncbi:tRNA (adenosine(37)-N6)-dimethylallyltransferase MiaA [Tenuibacillus multivorans]|uniref:tRNA dimethylallyltransferase n=1 Tax=Tenuibacillus multivorans TaxID=237069 RepID=A0A1G9XT63_9BACI|nr:tRNA (adenosine(37)-N6)-dimethylallyltransferase MiaA [Tenuibacillus multivorans]GEL75797.1 tRNA dimethylallyltransferase [Tenuibacillus multivorans]SDM99681.1 tRNA dimethylallyltransferase [Tenuibacillus multivorans]